MLYINVYVSLSSTRIPCRFGRMPEYVLSKVLGGAIIMGRREYTRTDKNRNTTSVAKRDKCTSSVEFFVAVTFSRDLLKSSCSQRV